MIIDFKKEDLEGQMLPQFYDIVGKYLINDTDDVHYDCKKIQISKKIQDEIYRTYQGENLELYQKNPNAVNQYITGLLTCFGPKVSDKLTEYQVEVLDGFLF